MKKNYVLAASLLGACWVIAVHGCAQSPNTGGSGGSSGKGSGGSSSSGGSSGGSTSSGGTGGSSTGSGGSSTGSGGSNDGSGGSGSSCEMPSLMVFPRSDTGDSWDDNDFSEVTVDGSCPAVATVTWPHEAGWENGDPSEANREQVHFTLDSYHSSDLTGKQLDLELELTDDKRGSSANAGGYIVSLVSVSSYDKVVTGSGGMSGTGGSDAGGAPGAGGTGGSDGSAGAGGGAAGGRNGGNAGRGGGMGGRRGGGGGRGGGAGSPGGGADGSAGGIAGGAGGGAEGGSSGSGGDGSGGSGDTPTIVVAYSEAETPAGDRKTLSKTGDKVSMSFKLPNKGTAVDSYDPARPVKINIRIYTVFTTMDAATYDYMTSRFTIRKFEVTDAK